jgi:hypothetical protein
MVKVIQVDENGAEVAVVELDERTIAVFYTGISSMLKTAAQKRTFPPHRTRLSMEAFQRRNCPSGTNSTTPASATPSDNAGTANASMLFS